MRVIFACGGTAGHIYPAIAVANEIKRRDPSAEIIFVGAKGKMETELVPREGYKIETVEISGFSRKKNFAGLKHNLKTLRNISASRRQAKKILSDFMPDVVVGTGGYASYPILSAAAKRKIPTAIHESNATPGLTTKVLSKKVDKVMVAFEASRSGYGDPDKVIVTGTPVRAEFVKNSSAKNRPLIVSFWGSLGASVMNAHMAQCMALESADGGYRHIHATGKGNLEKFMTDFENAGGKKRDELDVREYIFDMPELMAQADLIVCRAGASTLAEIMAAGVASILVPSPYVTDNHQEKNARMLESNGAAVVITEPESSGNRLFETVSNLLINDKKRMAMAAAAKALCVENATEKICDIVLELVK